MNKYSSQSHILGSVTLVDATDASVDLERTVSCTESDKIHFFDTELHALLKDNVSDMYSAWDEADHRSVEVKFTININLLRFCVGRLLRGREIEENTLSSQCLFNLMQFQGVFPHQFHSYLFNCICPLSNNNALRVWSLTVEVMLILW